MRASRRGVIAVALAALIALGQWVAMAPAQAFEGSVDLNITTPSPITVYPSCVLVVDGYAYVSDGSNSSPSYISVVRVSDGTVVGWLPAGTNSAGIATAYGKVFVVAAYGQDVTVIDSSTRLVTSTISNAGTTPAGGTLVPWTGSTAFANPIGIEVGTVSGHQYLFVANIYSGLTVIDADTNRIVSTIDVPGENWGLAVSGNYAYVPDRYGATATVIDITKAVNDPTHATVSTITLPANSKPVTGVVAEGYLYLTDWHNGSVDLVDVSKAVSDPTHAYAATVAVGANPFGGILFNGRVYISNGGANSVSVIDASTRTVVDTLTASDLQGPGGGLSGAGNVLYVPSGGNHRLLGIAVAAAPGPSPPSSSAPSAPAAPSAEPEATVSPTPTPSATPSPEPSATAEPEPRAQLNGATEQRVAGSVSLVSASVVSQTRQRFMVVPISARIGRAPRVFSDVLEPLALVARGLAPSTEYVVKVKVSGVYSAVGTVTAAADGSVVLPVLRFDRAATHAIALVDPAGQAHYVKVSVR